MIEIHNLYKSFGPQMILNNLSLTIRRGETKAIIGRSGVGKSVLLKNIVGLIRPDMMTFVSRPTRSLVGTPGFLDCLPDFRGQFGGINLTVLAP